MNIVCIFGNGFDLNLGLNTSYQHFYDHYLEQDESDQPSVRELREQIRSDYRNWSDLEMGLGAHSKHLETVDDVDNVFYDISENLANYLEGIEADFDYSTRKSDVFFADAVAPEKYLNAQERVDYAELRNKLFANNHSNRVTQIDVLTFNYTRSVERILGEQASIDDALSSVDSPTKVSFRGVLHIHGQLGETPVLGVNDASQIANEKLRSFEEAMEVCVKPKHNGTIGHMIDPTCASKISNANIICIFGSSLGVTDNIWWERIGNRLQHDCVLFIFARDIEIPASRLAKLIRLKRNVRSQFLAKTSLSDEAVESISKKIFVGINQPIYNL